MAYWRLQEIAKPQRWSARRIASETGLAYTTVWGIWSGHTKRADLTTIQRIADVIGVEAHELIGDGEVEPRTAPKEDR